MIKILFLSLVLSTGLARAQYLWEKNDKQVCVQTKTNVDDVRNNLKEKFGKECDYQRNSLTIIVGNFFKCGDKMNAYFRTENACKYFHTKGKKDLLKFAPEKVKNPQRWNTVFGKCMETATQKQILQMGLQTLNSFCYCVAENTTSVITSQIVQDCSRKLK